MQVLQPFDIGRDQAGAGFDAAVIAINGGVLGPGRTRRVFEEPAGSSSRMTRLNVS